MPIPRLTVSADLNTICHVCPGDPQLYFPPISVLSAVLQPVISRRARVFCQGSTSRNYTQMDPPHMKPHDVRGRDPYTNPLSEIYINR
jgi:hypothetical protein